MNSIKSLVSTCSLFVALISVTLAGPATKGEKPLHVSHGAEVDLSSLAVKGKTTIFDFTSDFCPPCRVIAPKLDALHAQREDLAVVKVDINRPGVKKIDWDSPVAKQYALRSIPHFKVFGPDGKLQAEGQEARALVNGWLK